MASSFDPRHEPGSQPFRDGLAQLGARVAAECEMQLQICQALQSVADGLPVGGGVALVRLLQRIVEPSWSEHVSLQEGLIFPVLMRPRISAPAHKSGDRLSPDRGAGAVKALLQAYAREHEEITKLNVRGARCLAALAGGARADNEAIAVLGNLAQARRRHVSGERDMLVALLPVDAPPIERIQIDALIWGLSWPRLRGVPPRGAH